MSLKLLVFVVLIAIVEQALASDKDVFEKNNPFQKTGDAASSQQSSMEGGLKNCFVTGIKIIGFKARKVILFVESYTLLPKLIYKMLTCFFASSSIELQKCGNAALDDYYSGTSLVKQLQKYYNTQIAVHYIELSSCLKGNKVSNAENKVSEKGESLVKTLNEKPKTPNEALTTPTQAPTTQMPFTERLSNCYSLGIWIINMMKMEVKARVRSFFYFPETVYNMMKCFKASDAEDMRQCGHEVIDDYYLYRHKWSSLAVSAREKLRAYLRMIPDCLEEDMGLGKGRDKPTTNGPPKPPENATPTTPTPTTPTTPTSPTTPTPLTGRLKNCVYISAQVVKYKASQIAVFLKGFLLLPKLGYNFHKCFKEPNIKKMRQCSHDTFNDYLKSSEDLRSLTKSLQEKVISNLRIIPSCLKNGMGPDTGENNTDTVEKPGNEPSTEDSSIAARLRNCFDIGVKILRLKASKARIFFARLTHFPTLVYKILKCLFKSGSREVNSCGHQALANYYVDGFTSESSMDLLEQQIATLTQKLPSCLKDTDTTSPHLLS